MNAATDEPASDPSTSTLTLRTALTLAGAFALSVGFLDIIISMLRIPAGFSSFIFVLSPLAATTVASVLACVVLFIPMWIIGRLFKARVQPYTISLTLFAATLFALASLADLIPSSVLPEFTSKGDYLLKFGLLLVVSCPVGVGAYSLAALAASTPRIGRSAASFGLAIPFLLCETMVLVWLEKYRLEFTSRGSLLAIASFGVVVLMTLAFFYVAGHRPWTKALLGCLGLLVVLSPVLTVAQVKREQASSANYAPASKPIPHVFLIVVDTLRADFLSCYNPQALPTPNIDQLAQDGLLFRNAVSPAPWTVPAMVSILTGTSPRVHQLNYFGAELPDTFKTVAEYMEEAGYYTGAIGDNGNLNPGLNFDQGFHSYNWFSKRQFEEISVGSSILCRLFPRQFKAKPTTLDLVTLAVDWTQKNQGANTFLWLHVFDPHMPYTPPRRFMPEGQPPSGLGTRFVKEDVARGMNGKLGRTAEERAWIRGLYNGEVRLVDEQLGAFLQTLRDSGLYEDALIVLTADHGEEFWEHGGYEHGQSLYGEQLSVPLIVKLPHQESQGMIDAVVSTESIMPSVLDLCEVDHDAGQFSAPSLAPLCQKTPGIFQAQPVLSTGLMRGDEREAITGDGFRYIRSLVTGREELYDLQEDPGEQANAVESTPTEVEANRVVLQEQRERARVLRVSLGFPDTEPEEVELDKSTVEALRDIGYL